jgi:ComF family protein
MSVPLLSNRPYPAWPWLARLGAGRCEVCRSWSGAAHGAICAQCRARFAAPRLRCPSCALPLDHESAPCGRCNLRPFAFSHCITVTDYGHPWDRLIAQFKFHAHPELAIALASCLNEAIALARGTDAAPPRPDLVLPVPLGAQRLRERGYNQAWELARRIARQQRLAARADILLRWRETAQQTGLGLAERSRNLRQAFVVAPRQAHALRRAHVALVDDVCTSGATADAAARTLLGSGAATVQLWVVARTPATEH